MTAEDTAAEVFRKARAVPILDVIKRHVADVKLKPSSGRMRGPCPLCGAGRKGSAPFSVDPRKGVWHCHAEGIGGGGVELVMAAQGCDDLGAAEIVAGLCARDAKASSPRRDAPDRAAEEAREAAKAGRRERFIRDLIDWHWRTAAPAAGSPVEAWFAYRGLDAGAIPGMIHRLRFHPDALAGTGDDGRGGRWEVRAPAMLALVHAFSPALKAFAPVALHMTYLRPGGRGPARLIDPADGEALPKRKIYGPYKGGAVLLTAMGDVVAPRGPLIVGEGIETVAGYAQLHLRGAAFRAAAALSLDNLCGRPKRDAMGCFDPGLPRRDPAHAAFSFPCPGEVIALIDRDMSPVEAWVRGPDRRRMKRPLDQDERARIAGSLALQAWRAAGATATRAATAPKGMDWNDAARAAAMEERS